MASDLIGFDAVVAGRGPAGYASAIALRQQGYRVMMIGRTDLSSARWGETVPGTTAIVLSKLGVGEALSAEGHGACVTHRSCWGEVRLRERTAMQNPHGGGHLIAHERLIDALHARLLDLDTCVLDGQVLDVMRDDDGYRLRIECQGEETFVRARALIDATGRGARIAQRLGARRESACRLISLGAIFKVPADVPMRIETIVESRPGGWLYAAPLSPSKAVVWWITDTLPSSFTRMQRTDLLMQEADDSLHIGTWLALHRLSIEGESVVRDASVGALDHKVGDRWLAVGDAAASLDPLSSSGITSALMGGLHAANALSNTFDGDEQALTRYAAAIDEVFATHLQKRRQYYAMERRWETGFWQGMQRFTQMS
ncbi:NAD(P)/FAD-dependent oxidoreductase, partial [Caballeronia sp. BR00000012568055]|uniref:NAD(P)/FAD-dependent oxidoreductase n=1 Tax=Caballeronia sp. BR00000012568055 TaxID=2918761 RepID=UPI0023F83DCE